MGDLEIVKDFYEKGAEVGRLQQGLGLVEAQRTKELLARFLPAASTICDIGGGVGYYSDWLAGKGHIVTMVELAESAVTYARAHQENFFTALVGDARHLPLEDGTMDAALLMGPLYHLQEWGQRRTALQEAWRVLRPGGLVMAAAISKYSSMTWALSVYGVKNNYLDEETYRGMLKRELATGEHVKPAQYNCLCDAFFHTPEGLRKELEAVGFQVEGLYAVEGCAWLTPCLSEKWEDPESRERLLELVALTEQEPSLLGVSPHMLAVARREEGPAPAGV